MCLLSNTLHLIAVVHLFILLDNFREASSEDINVFSITCGDKFSAIQGKVSSNTFTVKCPTCELMKCYVLGTGFYTPSSTVCCAGVHDGKMNNNGSVMIVNFHHERKGKFKGTKQHEVKSLSLYPEQGSYFTLTSLPKPTAEETTAPVPTAIAITKGNDRNASYAAGTTTSPVSLSSLLSTNGNMIFSSKAAYLLTDSRRNDSKALEATTKGFKSDLTSTEMQEGTDETMPSTKVIILLVGIAAGAAFLLLLGILAARHFNTFFRNCGKGVDCNRRSSANDCVCYLEMDSSNQSLLNDPTSCRRPCEIREFVQQQQEDKLDLGCSNRIDPDCENCTRECNSSPFAF